MDIKILNSYPPNFEMILEAFPHCREAKAIFAYGETIYNPFNRKIELHSIEHEKIHFAQQSIEHGATLDDKCKAWWYKYVHDIAFRFEQEVEAYRYQYAFTRKHVSDRETLSWFLGKLSENLSSTLYGSMCTRSEARRLIESKPKGG